MSEEREQEICRRLFALLPAGSKQVDREYVKDYRGRTWTFACIKVRNTGKFPTAEDLDLNELAPVEANVCYNHHFGYWRIIIYNDFPRFADGRKYDRSLPVQWPCRCHKCPHNTTTVD